LSFFFSSFLLSYLSFRFSRLYHSTSFRLALRSSQVSPQYILPAFYLLDSISKNIGPPYLVLFARFLERTFLSAYHSVDPTTKVKLEELLGTWKTGGSDGGELFRMHDEGKTGGRVQKGIETQLFGATGRGGGMGAMGRGRDAAESYNAGVSPHSFR
jgi:pre-mRNA cleavage complex 2 protein Pcf11